MKIAGGFCVIGGPSNVGGITLFKSGDIDNETASNDVWGDRVILVGIFANDGAIKGRFGRIVANSGIEGAIELIASCKWNWSGGVVV